MSEGTPTDADDSTANGRDGVDSSEGGSGQNRPNGGKCRKFVC